MTPETLFPIASISKSFTATGLGMLADAKKLDWDQPVREIVTEFALKDPVASDHATTRDLLMHRTGLPRHDRLWYRSRVSRLEIGQGAAVSRAMPATSGAAWQYNNLMYLTAGWSPSGFGPAVGGVHPRADLRPAGDDGQPVPGRSSGEADDFACPYDKLDGRSAASVLSRSTALGPAGAWSPTPRRWSVTCDST